MRYIYKSVLSGLCDKAKINTLVANKITFIGKINFLNPGSY